MISKVVAGVLLVLTLSSCSSNTPGSDGSNPERSNPSQPNPGHPNPGGDADPIVVESLGGLLCLPSKAEVAVEKCISAMSEIDKLIELPRRLSTWGSLETNEFVDVLLDRKAFKDRFRLSDREVQCLKSKMCMEQ